MIFFEARKKKDLYVWLSKSPDGPSVKFLAANGEHSPSLQQCPPPFFAGTSLEGVSQCLIWTHVVVCAAVHTLAELKLGGNHLKGSRPVLSFHAVSTFPSLPSAVLLPHAAPPPMHIERQKPAHQFMI